jgi:hypothetical protein
MDRADYEREVQKRLDEGHSPLDTVRYIKVKYLTHLAGSEWFGRSDLE